MLCWEGSSTHETITSPELSAEISSKYSTGRYQSYEHVTLMRTEEWDKPSTIQNMNINLPRKSMRGIVLLFKSKTLSDSEEFVYTNIDRVKLTIEGIP